MGRSIHTLDQLCDPLALIDERFSDIPVGTDLLVSNRAFKVLIFLEAEHELLLEGHPTLTVRGGDLLIQPLPINQIYRAIRKTSSSRIHTLRLLLDLPLPKPVEQAGIRKDLSSRDQGLRKFMQNHLTGIHYLPRFVTPPVQEQIARLREEGESHRLGYRFEASRLGFSLILSAIRQIHELKSSQKQAGTTRARAIVEGTKEYLLENLESSLTLDQIAWHVRLSREHLARIFRVTTGQTVFAYLTQLRIEEAKRHLCDLDLPVVEIARRTGFSSSALFCRTFKRAMKMTPLGYRTRRMDEVRFSPSRLRRNTSGRAIIRTDFY